MNELTETKMKTKMNKIIKRSARISGILYLILIPLGFFGVAYVPSTLIDFESMQGTVNNIAANESFFRIGIVSVLLMNLISVALVLYLYLLFRQTNKNMAGSMVILLLFGACISMLNEVSHFATIFLSSNNTQKAFTAEQLENLVELFHNIHLYGAYIATIFWGLWLLPLGYLIIKSRFLPKILGYLLLIAGIGYLIDSFVFFLSNQYTLGLTDFTFIGELLFPLWLVIIGAKKTIKEKEATVL